MATKRRTDYQVDEEALKRMMAGDVTALDKMASPAEAPETKSRPAPFQEKQEKNSAGSPKQQVRKSTDEASGPDEYRRRSYEENCPVQEGRPIFTMLCTGLLPNYCLSLHRTCQFPCF